MLERPSGSSVPPPLQPLDKLGDLLALLVCVAEAKKKSLKRLNRIEDQVRGIARMAEGGPYCIGIMTQIAAVQAASARLRAGYSGLPRSVRPLLGHIIVSIMPPKRPPM
jgi:Metal-sensitive transcriptional repressor